MGSIDNQKVVFEFFLQHLETKEAFTRQQLEEITTWQGRTFPTYWSKQFRPFLVQDQSNPNYFRVSEAFRRIATWEQFRQHVTQVRSLTLADYQPLRYDLVRVYEFFMPLTNEAFLRAALDALFFRDTIEARLRTINPSELQRVFPQQENEFEDDYLDRLCEWLSDRFGGYSVYHVNGRFRALPLAVRSEAATASRYLVDETTAVTRFIFPCNDLAEADQVEFFFTTLFVAAITEAVTGEDEIWMVESGMKNRLHIWRETGS